MYSKETTIRNESGFHIRPAQLFVEQAGRYQSKITLLSKAANAEVDAKSILGLMTLGLSQGNPVVVAAEGPDEREAVESLVALIDGGFGEA
ncbi:HPr family phosphocarrier protein [Paenibacillus flagellatus]|uniref:Phosphocarrier protein HPr n=1 Tax=Paenibacillus flagellatus TaxID=2211139 RepID=A0A2V5KFD7_9BACL|nr:HPr family phosphocarrier protein [Paenibacillus flagellatus]PYI57134.1 HPr family phosphocarrier protein [Paenibacillus flagellatus]